MRKLQNNFTTFNQIIRLLELGVPADSADMYIECYWCDRSNGRWRHKADSHEMFGDRKQIGEGVGAIRPCWSVGRLIEIYCLATGVEYIKVGISEISLIELMIKMIEIAVKIKTFDFSRLEE